MIYADGNAPWISRDTAKQKVREFHARLAAKLEPFEFVLPEWNEAEDHHYETVKPNHMGRKALLL